jgi:hypothetical protein
LPKIESKFFFLGGGDEDKKIQELPSIFFILKKHF